MMMMMMMMDDDDDDDDDNNISYNKNTLRPKPDCHVKVTFCFT